MTYFEEAQWPRFPTHPPTHPTHNTACRCGVKETGLPFIMGMVVLLLLIPVQARVAKLLQRASKRASQLTDERVRLTKQAIHGARTIKMSGWEMLLDKRIREVSK